MLDAAPRSEGTGTIDATKRSIVNGPARDAATNGATPAPATNGATPDLLGEIERLKSRTDTLERELVTERERRTAIESAFDRQRDEARRLDQEAARLRTALAHGDRPAANMPQPVWTDRPVNPSLQTKWRWITRILVLIVLAAVLGATYLLVHAYIHHESIDHVWSGVRSAFWSG